MADKITLLTQDELSACLLDELRVAGEVAEINIKMRQELERQVAVLKAALEEYGNSTNWQCSAEYHGLDHGSGDCNQKSFVPHDRGYVPADEALAKLDTEGEQDAN